MLNLQIIGFPEELAAIRTARPITVERVRGGTGPTRAAALADRRRWASHPAYEVTVPLLCGPWSRIVSEATARAAGLVAG